MTNNRSKTAEQRVRADIRSKLIEMGKLTTRQDSLTFEGTRFIIPSTMDVNGAISYLEDYKEANESNTAFTRQFMVRPWDGAFQFERALVELTGTAGVGKAIRSMFGSTPPQRQSVQVDVGQHTEVPWGRVQVPMWEADCYLGSNRHEEHGLIFEVTVQTKKKYEHEVRGFFEYLQSVLDSEDGSIYRKKAIDGSLGFVDTSRLDADSVVYSQDVLRQLNANLWNLIENSDTHRKLGLPLKRAVLLAGDYGTGKTLCGLLTAQKAVANGWTFIHARPGKDNPLEAMQTGVMYGPAVVFIEDVDVVADPRSGALGVSALLDAFDGLGGKGRELVVVLTTNHPDRIHKGMLRPGRLDAVIELGNLDAAGIEKLSHQLMGEHLSPDIDWTVVAASMDVFTPAFAHEAIANSLRYALAAGDDLHITTESLVDSAKEKYRQLELMGAADEHAVDIPVLEQGFGALIASRVRNVLDGSKLLDYDDDEMYTLQTN